MLNWIDETKPKPVAAAVVSSTRSLSIIEEILLSKIGIDAASAESYAKMLEEEGCTSKDELLFVDEEMLIGMTSVSTIHRRKVLLPARLRPVVTHPRTPARATVASLGSQDASACTAPGSLACSPPRAPARHHRNHERAWLFVRRYSNTSAMRSRRRRRRRSRSQWLCSSRSR